MKINTGVNNLATGDLMSRQDKKDKTFESNNASKVSVVNSVINKNAKLSSYNISLDDSEKIMESLKNSFSNVGASIENLFSEFNNDSVISLLKETN